MKDVSLKRSSICDMWTYYGETAGIFYNYCPEAQHDLKASFYSGFGALLAIMDHMRELSNEEILERFKHFEHELKFAQRGSMDGPISRLEQEDY